MKSLTVLFAGSLFLFNTAQAYEYSEWSELEASPKKEDPKLQLEADLLIQLIEEGKIRIDSNGKLSVEKDLLDILEDEGLILDEEIKMAGGSICW